jgi:uncharacterized protein
MNGDPRPTYVLVDGENIDATLGGDILRRRPAPEERPRWDRVRDWVTARWDQPARGLFFLNVTGQTPMTFVQALRAVGYQPVLLSGPPDVKVVDVAIQRTLEALAEREDGVVWLVSHDGDFAPQLRPLVEAGRRVGVLAFRELLSGALAELQADGLELADLEDEVDAFQVALPRLRVVAIEDFDPWSLLR